VRAEGDAVRHILIALFFLPGEPWLTDAERCAIRFLHMTVLLQAIRWFFH
jgi:hypothetical protein